MADKIEREVHGILSATGERIHLGCVPMSDGELVDAVLRVQEVFAKGETPALQLGCSVYDLRAFCGVQFTPPIEFKEG